MKALFKISQLEADIFKVDKAIRHKFSLLIYNFKGYSVQVTYRYIKAIN